ncbi:two-component system, NarL family, sensor histidine kinase DesK [Marmoricola sp. URHA0025 HA25]
MLVALACSLVGRSLDAFPHPDHRYLPFVWALFVLPGWYASGRLRGAWARYRWQLLAVQGVLTVVPFALFGQHWVAGVSGLFAGLVLVLLPSRVAWPAYGALAILEVTLWSVVGLPYEPRGAAITWLLVAFVNQSLILFGLTRLADIVEGLDANRYALARAEVAGQRLTATRHLQETVQQRLHRIGELLAATLAADTASTRRDLVGEAGREAREAGADARRLALDLPDAVPPGGASEAGDTVAPRLARGIIHGVLLVYAVQYLVNVTVPFGTYRPGPGVVVGAVCVAVVVVAIQLRHSGSDGDARPSQWPWTLAALGGLCFVFYRYAGASSLVLLTFLAASSLLLIRHRVRWLLFAGVVVVVPVLVAVDPSGVKQTLEWSVYATAISTATSLLVYGLARLTRAAEDLHQAQRSLADAARVSERLRLARDAHDMLGLGLSTIALKTDLAAALLDQDPERSRQETVQALHLTRLVDTDVEAVSGDRVSLTLATEVETARSSLAAAGIHTEMEVDAALHNVDVLAPVLREAVTNVLRHSRAHRCSIRLTGAGGGHTLVVSNDGVVQTPGGEPGRGLVNMSERLHAVRGTLNTRIEDDEFTLTAAVPGSGAHGHDRVPVLQG